jgi:hypothetical protein
VKPDHRILRLCVGLLVVMVALAAAQTALERIAAGRLPRPIDGTTVDQLAGLTITADTGTGGYDRQRFGSGWDSGPDGCDTRSQVLVDESITPVMVDGCTILAGEWRSVYDAAHITDPAELDIDHLVPLAETWASGASDWTDQQRRAFANDTDQHRPDALIAVSAASNRAKGDRDPAEWLPPDPAVHCWYAQAWITQKTAWRLSIDPAEHQALAGILADCPPDQPGAGR